ANRPGGGPLRRRPLPGQSRHGAGRGAPPRLSLLRRQQPDDRLRPGEAPAHRLPAAARRRRRHQVRSRPAPHLRSLLQRIYLRVPGRGRQPLPQAGRSSRAEKSPQPGGGYRNPPRVRARAGREWQAGGEDGGVRGRGWFALVPRPQIFFTTEDTENTEENYSKRVQPQRAEVREAFPAAAIAAWRGNVFVWC